MKRERQIELLATAKQRAEDRVHKWHSDPKVQASAKADYLRPRAMKAEVQKRQSNS